MTDSSLTPTLPNPDPVAALRTALQEACVSRSRALLGLSDAVLTHPGPVSSFPELSEEASTLSHHQLYSGVVHGEVDADLLLTAALSVAQPQEGPFPYVAAFDATSIPRPYSPTSADRHMVLTNTKASVKVPTAGWELHQAVLLDPEMTSWVTPLCSDVTSEGSTSVVMEQLRRLVMQLTQRLLSVLDSGYDAMHLTSLVRQEKLNADLLVRLRSNSVMYRDVPPPLKKPVGRPQRHGTRINAKDEDRPAADLSLTHTHPLMGRVTLEAWGEVHPKLKHRGDFTDATKDELLVTGTFLHVQLHTPRAGKGSMWLWWTGAFPTPEELVALWWNYTRRYDIEHYFTLMKKSLGLEVYTPQRRGDMLTWSRVLVMSYLQLTVLKKLVTEVPRAWHTARRQGKLTPGRVRRVVSGQREEWLGLPVVPKLRRGGTGTPKGTLREARETYSVRVKSSE